jgi:hypothetical protein
MMPVAARSLWISLLVVLAVISLLAVQVVKNHRILKAYRPAVEGGKVINAIVTENGNENTHSQVGNVTHGNKTEQRLDMMVANKSVVGSGTHSNGTAPDSRVFSMARNAMTVVYLHGKMGNHLLMFAQA